MTMWAAEDGWPYPDALGDFVDLAGEADDDLLSVTADTHLFDTLDPFPLDDAPLPLVPAPA